MNNLWNYFLTNSAQCVSVVVAVVGFIISIVKLIKNKQWAKLKDALIGYIEQAELLNAEGKVKKEIVMAKARVLCATLGIKWNEDLVSALIEGLITLTNIVNTKIRTNATNSTAVKQTDITSTEIKNENKTVV